MFKNSFCVKNNLDGNPLLGCFVFNTIFFWRYWFFVIYQSHEESQKLKLKDRIYNFILWFPVLIGYIGTCRKWIGLKFFLINILETLCFILASIVIGVSLVSCYAVHYFKIFLKKQTFG